MSRLFLVLLMLCASANARGQDILVFGGTGNLGTEIVRRLAEQGRAVTVFVRPTSDRSRLADLDVRYVTGDVIEEADVAAALKSGPFDVIINAIARQPGETSPYVSGQENIADWAAATGVDQVILVSSVGAGEDASRDRYPDINWERFATSLAEKGQAEDALIKSGVGYTIIRTGAVLGEPGEPIPPPTGKGRLTEDQTVMGPITFGDLGVLVADCAAAARCLNKVFHATDDSLGEQYKRWRCMRFRRDASEKC